MVVAETYSQAKSAAELIDVDYEVLDATADVGSAQESSAPQVHGEAPNNTSFDWELGTDLKPKRRLRKRLISSSWMSPIIA